jgi:hypothetical protein
VIEIQEDNCVLKSADELKPRRSREKCSMVPEREPSACQKTKYRGKLGEVSGSREDLLLQRL